MAESGVGRESKRTLDLDSLMRRSLAMAASILSVLIWNAGRAIGIIDATDALGASVELALAVVGDDLVGIETGFASQLLDARY